MAYIYGNSTLDLQALLMKQSVPEMGDFGNNGNDSREPSETGSECGSEASLPRQFPKNAIRLNTRYKTELYHQFYELGHCLYGDRCVYAHGRHELNRHSAAVGRHPNYRTRVCTSYQYKGFCPFGSRCAFIHAQSDPVALLESTLNAYPKVPMPENPKPDRKHYEFWPLDTLYRKVDRQMSAEMNLLPSMFIGESYDRLPSFVRLTK